MLIFFRSFHRVQVDCLLHFEKHAKVIHFPLVLSVIMVWKCHNNPLYCGENENGRLLLHMFQED